jgi:hypothetical protein
MLLPSWARAFVQRAKVDGDPCRLSRKEIDGKYDPPIKYELGEPAEGM